MYTWIGTRTWPMRDTKWFGISFEYLSFMVVMVVLWVSGVHEQLDAFEICKTVGNILFTLAISMRWQMHAHYLHHSITIERMMNQTGLYLPIYVLFYSKNQTRGPTLKNTAIYLGVVCAQWTDKHSRICPSYVVWRLSKSTPFSIVL